MIQTRHRIPETPLAEGQILVYQVPIPEPLRWVEKRETETRKMHALEEYGVMHVKLYEDIARFGCINTSYNYPVLVNGRYLMAPSPIPKFDNPKMHRNPALQLFGAGREKRIYAVPPYTSVESLDFEDYPFEIQHWDHVCALCGAGTAISTKSSRMIGADGCSSVPTPTIARRGKRRVIAARPNPRPPSKWREDGHDRNRRSPAA